MKVMLGLIVYACLVSSSTAMDVDPRAYRRMMKLGSERSVKERALAQAHALVTEDERGFELTNEGMLRINSYNEIVQSLVVLGQASVREYVVFKLGLGLKAFTLLSALAECPCVGSPNRCEKCIEIQCELEEVIQDSTDM